jgi:hypothetical protein
MHSLEIKVAVSCYNKLYFFLISFVIYFVALWGK